MTGTIHLREPNPGNFSFTIGNDHPGNGAEYSLENSVKQEDSFLEGKTFFWLGSSITYGFGSKGESMADFIAKRNGSCSYKSAISGTTLAEIVYDKDDDNNPWKHLGRDEASLEETAAQSYVKRLSEFPKEIRPDVFIIQVSTNDSQFPEEYQGKLSEGEEVFDIHTTLGAMEYIVSYILKTWDCPVMFYTSPLLDSENYRAMVEATKRLCEKWSIDLLDMNGDCAFNQKGRENYDLYMVDMVHPTRAGYLNWWTPVFEEKIREILEEKND